MRIRTKQKIDYPLDEKGDATRTLAAGRVYEDLPEELAEILVARGAAIDLDADAKAAEAKAKEEADAKAKAKK